MKIISFQDMYHTDFSLTHLSVNYRTQKAPYISTAFYEKPRACNHFIFLQDCDASITLRNGCFWQASSGSIIYLPKGVCYKTTFSKQSEYFHISQLFFQLTDGIEEFVASENPLVIDFISSEYIHNVFDELIAIKSKPTYSPSQFKAKVYELMYRICKSFYQEKIYSKTYAPIAKGIQYLEKESTPELSIAEIAQMCNVSESYFRRLFQQYAGVSPSAFQTQNLIRRAKELLLDSDLNISEISDQLKMQDPNYFSRVFKKKVGISPSEYRSQKTT